MKCKKCKREFFGKRGTRIKLYCCDNCRIADHKGIKSKWEKIIEIFEDKEAAKVLGYEVKKISEK